MINPAAINQAGATVPIFVFMCVLPTAAPQLKPAAGVDHSQKRVGAKAGVVATGVPGNTPENQLYAP
jgi:hypothetical protein